MPWIPWFVIMSVCCGVICSTSSIGSHLLDNNLRLPFESVQQSEAINTNNNNNFIKTLRYSRNGLSTDEEDPPCPPRRRHRYSGELNVYDPKNCEASDGIRFINEKMDFDSLNTNTGDKRDFTVSDTRDIRENLNMFSNKLDVNGIDGGVSDRDNNLIDFGRRIELTQLPASIYSDFYEDLMVDGSEGKEDIKRGGVGSKSSLSGCDCKIRNDLLDLGQQHFPRYLLNAICQTEQSPNEYYQQKCWHGSYCKPLEYKVKVLTFRTIIDHVKKDPSLAWLPDDLRQLWKFKTVTVSAGCFCSY